jgi:hypothetical protein
MGERQREETATNSDLLSLSLSTLDHTPMNFEIRFQPVVA